MIPIPALLRRDIFLPWLTKIVLCDRISKNKDLSRP